MASNGWYAGAIEGLRKAESQKKCFIWLDDWGDEVFEHEAELRARLGSEDEEDLSDLLWSGMEGDPDKFNFNGERVPYYTVENCESGTQYIIIAPCDLESDQRVEAEKYLTEFYGQDMRELFDECKEQSWNYFESEVKNKFIVAFRGGYGYNYALWEKEIKTTEEK